MEIYSQNVYEIIENNTKKYVLIIYNISQNHYVGIPVYNSDSNNLTYIPSISKFIDIDDIQEYSRKNIKRITLC